MGLRRSSVFSGSNDFRAFSFFRAGFYPATPSEDGARDRQILNSATFQRCEDISTDTASKKAES